MSIHGRGKGQAEWLVNTIVVCIWQSGNWDAPVFRQSEIYQGDESLSLLVDDESIKRE
jgi:hypothetical protein